MTRPAAEWPGLRVLYRLGPDRVARTFLVIFLVAAWAQTILVARPDLQSPTSIGTDSSNYYAAGLRLNVGHELYALAPGDREVILEPPLWTVPILSPPTIGALWRPIALLPAEVAMTGWWLCGLVVYTLLVGWLALRLPPRHLAALAVLGTSAALVAWSGNVNTFLSVVLVGVWFTYRHNRPALSGGLAAIAAALKLTPAFLLVWLLVCGGRRAVIGFCVAMAAILAVTLVTTGPASFVDYLEVIRDTSTIGVTPYSIAGFLRGWGAPEVVAWAATPGVVIVGAAAVWLLRKRPGAAFAVSIFVSVYGSPVVYMQTVGLLVAALAPAAERTRGDLARPS